MTSNRFYLENVNLDSLFVFLEGEEHHHLCYVARVNPRDVVWLFDSQGKSYSARVEEIHKDKTKLRILETFEKREKKNKILLAQALLKAKKMEFIIQKSVELGIVSFFPVITARSITRIEENVEKKIKRWRKIALEAAKQSNNPQLPSIFPPFSLKRLIDEVDAEKKLFFHEDKGTYLREVLLKGKGKSGSISEPPSSTIILIGPEGGWTEEETEFVVSQGYERISLGENILKSETAALSSLAMISHFWNN